jgi:hypothetical protein
MRGEYLAKDSVLMLGFKSIENAGEIGVRCILLISRQVSWRSTHSTDGKFKSAALDTDDKFQFRFTAAGEYPFFCRMHPKMTGKIVVQP